MYKLKSSTFSSIFSFSGSKQAESKAEGNDLIRPPTPRNASRTRKSSSPESPRRRSSTSFLNMSNPFENIRARSGSLSRSLSEVRIAEIQPEPSENLLDRSVKIAFPKRGLSNGEAMTEIVLRERISEFGQVVNVGMKEKLAVVLFKTSNQAIIFSNFHDNLIGPDYKIKYMGTKTLTDEELQKAWTEQKKQNRIKIVVPTSASKASTDGTDTLTKFSPSPHQQNDDVDQDRIGNRSVSANSCNYSRQLTDTHASNQSQTRCGSETESDTDADFAKSSNRALASSRHLSSTDGASISRSPVELVRAIVPSEKVNDARREEWQSASWKHRVPMSIEVNESCLKEEDEEFSPRYLRSEEDEQRGCESRKESTHNRAETWKSAAAVTRQHSDTRMPYSVDQLYGKENKNCMDSSNSAEEVTYGGYDDGGSGGRTHDRNKNKNTPPRNNVHSVEELCNSPDRVSVQGSREMGVDLSSDRSQGKFPPHSGTRLERGGEREVEERRGEGGGRLSSSHLSNSQPSSNSNTNSISPADHSPNRMSTFSVLSSPPQSRRGVSSSDRYPVQSPTSVNTKSDDLEIFSNTATVRENSIDDDEIFDERRSYDRSRDRQSHMVANKVGTEVIKIEGTMNQRNQDRGSVSPIPDTIDSAWKQRSRDEGVARDREREMDREKEKEKERESGVKNGRMPVEPQRRLKKEQGSRSVSTANQHDEKSYDSAQMDRNGSNNRDQAANSRQLAAEEELERMEIILDGLLSTNSILEKDLMESRKKVLHLESQVAVQSTSREEGVASLDTQRDQWAVQLTAQSQRALALEIENKILKEAAEGSRIENTINMAKISSLTEFLRTAQLEVIKFKKELEESEREKKEKESQRSEIECSQKDANKNRAKQSVRLSESLLISTSAAACIADVHTKDMRDASASNADMLVVKSDEREENDECDDVSEAIHTDHTKPLLISNTAHSSSSSSAPSSSSAIARTGSRLQLNGGDRKGVGVGGLVSQYVPKVSDCLLQDLLATRREIEALNRMHFTFRPHSSNAIGSHQDRRSGSVDIPRSEGRYSNNNKSYTPHGYYDQNKDTTNLQLHSIARGDYFSLPEKKPIAEICHRNIYRHMSPPLLRSSVTSTYIDGSNRTYYNNTESSRTPPIKAVRSPPLMTYYGHLQPERQVTVQAPVPSTPPSNSKEGRRREYLLKLSLAD